MTTRQSPTNLALDEPLTGRIGEVLTARFARLPDVESAHLCVPQSLQVALTATLNRLHGVHAVAVTEPTYDAAHLHDVQTHRLYYPLDEVPDKVPVNLTHPEPGLVVTVSFDSASAHAWRRTFLTATPEAGLAMRREHLTEHLARALVLRHTITDRLGLPFPSGVAEETRWADQYGALLVWWQARIAQGYDPEAAATMLGLVCHPSVFEKVSFRAPDGTPVIAQPPR